LGAKNRSNRFVHLAEVQTVFIFQLSDLCGPVRCGWILDGTTFPLATKMGAILTAEGKAVFIGLLSKARRHFDPHVRSFLLKSKQSKKSVGIFSPSVLYYPFL
jgi:hypothetical protein